MIISVSYTKPAPSQAVCIATQDGGEWTTDASLPPDTGIRQMLADWLEAGGIIAPYVAPPLPVPPSIARRQCAKELYARGLITGPEMVAMTRTGEPPAMVEAILSAMPEADVWDARADFAADTYLRNNILLVDMMTASGATPSDIDDFFRQAAAR
jgi:hypothetical protein